MKLHFLSVTKAPYHKVEQRKLDMTCPISGYQSWNFSRREKSRKNLRNFFHCFCKSSALSRGFGTLLHHEEAFAALIIARKKSRADHFEIKLQPRAVLFLSRFLKAGNASDNKVRWNIPRWCTVYSVQCALMYTRDDPPPHVALSKHPRNRPLFPLRSNSSRFRPKLTHETNIPPLPWFRWN